jgi:lipoprotein-releasing system permease protein
MRTPLLVGLRFMLSRNTTRFLSLITKVSVFGLMLGVMALVIVVSVMNGFDTQLKHRILGAAPHVISKTPLQDPGVIASAEFLRYQGMVLAGDSRLVSIFGIDPKRENEVSVIPDHMVEGAVTDLNPGSNTVIMGATLGARLGLWMGDKTTLLIPVASAGGNSVVPKIARVTVAGFFRLNSELDHGLLLMNVQDLQSLVGADQVQFRNTLDDIFAAGQYAHSPQIETTWYEDYGDFFAAVRMEKIMMFLLLTMIVLIAALNTVSGLSMMVKEKQSEIAVLRTMGLPRHQVSLIFIVQGSMIGFSGVLLGLIFGLPIAFNVTEVVGFFENLAGGRMLAGTYFDRVPTDVRWADIGFIAAVSMLIAVLATLYPAFRAGQLEPAQVLRAE